MNTSARVAQSKRKLPVIFFFFKSLTYKMWEVILYQSDVFVQYDNLDWSGEFSFIFCRFFFFFAIRPKNKSGLFFCLAHEYCIQIQYDDIRHSSKIQKFSRLQLVLLVCKVCLYFATFVPNDFLTRILTCFWEFWNW